MKKRLLTKQIIAMGILCLAAQVGVNTARADLVNGNFGDGFNGWTAETIFDSPDPTTDPRYSNLGNTVTLAINDLDWGTFLYQDFAIGADAELLSFDYDWDPTDSDNDFVQASLEVDNTFYDLFVGLSNAEIASGGSISFDISGFQSQSAKITFGITDWDWNTEDTFSFGNIQITSASAPVPEPSTVLLIGIGLAGLAGVRRKQKQ